MDIQPLFIMAPGSITIDTDLLNTLNNNGYNRSGSPLKLIKANTDADAINVFLKEYTESPNTLTSYAKEIERLLLWCLHVAKNSLSELTRDHIVEYQAFMKNPAPQARWCGTKASRYKKNGDLNPEWRPFYKGLSDTSAKKALKILDSLFSYLVEMHYFQGNPVAMDRRRKRNTQTGPRLVERYLEMDELIAVLDALEAYPLRHHARDRFRVARARYIILLLFYSGMRISEASNHTMGNFIQRNGCWFLSIVGKGKKPRDIPVPDELLKALALFRGVVGLTSSEPTFKEPTPLIPNLDLTHALQVRRIDQLVKWAFHLGADALESQSPHKASKLRQASAHWLRHSYVTYLLDSGTALKVVQENAGHSNISTTMLYRHVSQTDRHTATRHLALETVDTTPVLEKSTPPPSPRPVKTVILGPNNLIEKTITLKMHFYVENNSKFVRGKGRSQKKIEEDVFSRYDVGVLDKECGDYEITLTYTNYENLDKQIQEIVSQAEWIADSRNGVIEFDVYTFDGEKSWPFVY